jgi:hypothetical protein
LRMPPAKGTGNSLNEELGVFVNEDGHKEVC